MYLVFITSEQILEFKTLLIDNNYEVINECSGLYSHYMYIDTVERKAFMVDKDEEVDYLLYTSELITFK